MKKKKKSLKVIIAMSGGIDSSVAAALLKKEGYNLIGVFMKFWAEPLHQTSTNSMYNVKSSARYGVGAESDKNGLVYAYNRCCSPESEKRARLVAKKLGIPFYVFNFEKEFKKKIVDYFLKEYKAGLTPNPCVVCNKEIKFGLLFRKLLFLDADFIATGHYVKKSKIKNPVCVKASAGRQKSKEEYKLLKGKDKNKDQSYFLWQLNQKVLKQVLFPVGDYTKNEVRKLAIKFKLPVVDIPESQEVCFIQTTTNDFLKRHLKVKPGKTINTKGEVIGKHQGLWFYTIGQRRGLGISGVPAFANASAGKPYYVLSKDIKKNVLVVTRNKEDLFSKELVVEDVNWISGKVLKLPLKVMAKIRYGHRPALSLIKKNGKIYKVIFLKPQKAITSGQSIVFYRGQELLGGGVIKGKY